MNFRSLFSITNKEFVTGIAVLLLSIAIIAGSRLMRLYDSQAVSSNEPAQIYLDGPTQLPELSDSLNSRGVITNQQEFEWAAKIFGWRNFQEGHYRVDRSFTYNEFLSKLARGVQDPVNVTVLPGRSEGEIARMVSNSLQLDSADFHQAITDTAVLGEINLRPEDVVGRFFPNTYSVFWTTSAESFFERIIREFNAVIEEHQERIEESDLTIEEVITLASIVEWEAKDKSEKKRISGLYWNRLNQGMRLQSDPTVNFAVGERRRLLYEDYNVDHPYNTYRNSGLPPGPITNPDMQSIEAALYPEDHDYLYMVASPEGSHSFSETFEEHRQKSAEWRQWIQEQYRIKQLRENGSQ